MKIAVLLLALLAASFALPCTYQDKMNRQYDLSRLRLHRGQRPYTHSENGVKYEFNVCGDMDGLNVSTMDTKAVVLRNGENAGQRAEWSDLSSKERGVEIVYGEGAVCKSSNRKTTFEFLCDEQRMESLYVFRVQPVDSCYEIVTLYTSAACPLGDMVSQSEAHESIFPFPTVSIALLLLGCCLCTIYSVRRRKHHQMIKKQNRENQMIQFSNVAFQQIPMEEFPTAPRVAPSVPQRNQPFQFLQAPQYFVYPSVQAPVQQEPASLESDEEMARRMQAEWN